MILRLLSDMKLNSWLEDGAFQLQRLLNNKQLPNSKLSLNERWVE